jgi:hypothetical protein
MGTRLALRWGYQHLYWVGDGTGAAFVLRANAFASLPYPFFCPFTYAMYPSTSFAGSA